jgi:hypothetical protein
MSETKALFDKAIELPPGKKLIVPAISVSHRDSLRTQFYRDRTKWKDSVATTDDIVIRRFDLKGRPCVLLEKVGAAPPAFVIDENGDIEEVVILKRGLIKEEQSSLSCPEGDETERMKEAMRADGMTEEEITSFFDGCATEEEFPDDGA